MLHAPIALFVYNRPKHLRRVVEALLTNPESADSDLYVYSDGAKNKLSTTAVQEVRQYLQSINGFRSITIKVSNFNKGLSRSIIDGLSEILNSRSEVIVLEDDLLVSPFFLAYMNEGLKKYSDEEGVCSIHGYCYPIPRINNETFFLRGADCWGWATWRRAWDYFEPNGKTLLSILEQEGLMKKFDLDGAYPYVRMLKDQIKGRNNSWAIRWHASCFIKNMMTLYPAASLVQNIGTDNSGTHCNTTDAFNVDLANKPIQVYKINVIENLDARIQVAQFFKSERNISRRVVLKIKRILFKVGIKI